MRDRSYQHVEKDPSKAERVAIIMDRLLDPSNKESHTALGKKHGLHPETVKRLHMELMTHHQDEIEELRQINGKQLTARIEDKLSLALDHMTKEKYEKATLQQVSINFGILMEKRQLLRGEPTAIISIEESRNLGEMANQVYKELNRRGMAVTSPVFEGDFEAVDAHVDHRPEHVTRYKKAKNIGSPQSKMR